MKKIRILRHFSAIPLEDFIPAAKSPSPDEPMVIQNAPQLMRINDIDFSGPIAISKALLTKGSVSEEIYLISLSGTKCFLRNVNSLVSCILVGLSLPNMYLSKLKKLAVSHIPAGAKLVLTGHSLGGMIAQQFAADRKMKSRYEILNLTCFGTPTVFTGKKAGSFFRLAERQDLVPLLSFRFRHTRRYNISYEAGDYEFGSYGSHNESYPREDVWGDYDCFGVKGGDAVISYYPRDMYRLPYRDGSLLF